MPRVEESLPSANSIQTREIAYAKKHVQKEGKCWKFIGGSGAAIGLVALASAVALAVLFFAPITAPLLVFKVLLITAIATAVTSKLFLIPYAIQRLAAKSRPFSSDPNLPKPGTQQALPPTNSTTSEAKSAEGTPSTKAGEGAQEGENLEATVLQSQNEEIKIENEKLKTQNEKLGKESHKALEDLEEIKTQKENALKQKAEAETRYQKAEEALKGIKVEKEGLEEKLRQKSDELKALTGSEKKIDAIVESTPEQTEKKTKRVRRTQKTT